MPKEQEEFQNAVFTILEAVMFENWLRFYFITEQVNAPCGPDGERPLGIAIPDKGMERITTLYPHLAPMAQAMNGKEVDFETSRRAVCHFVLMHVDGKTIPRSMADTVFESVFFQVQMQLFHTWVQLHDSQLDEKFLDFGTWRSLFAAWRDTEAARNLAEKCFLALQGGKTGASGSTTVA